MEKDVERNHKAFEHIYNYAFENIFNDFKKKINGSEMLSSGKGDGDGMVEEIFKNMSEKDKESLLKNIRVLFDETIAHVFFAVEDTEENERGKITMHLDEFKIDYPSEHFLSYLENRGDSPLYPRKKKV